MEMICLSDHDYALEKNYLLPVMSREVAAHDIDVKVENDLFVNPQDNHTEDTIDNDMVDRQIWPQLVAIEEIKFEHDAINQGIPNQENSSAERVNNSDMMCGLPAVKNITIDIIKAENEDNQGIINSENMTNIDVECRSAITNDFVTDDIKVEVIQEIITTEDTTNIGMMCRSTLPTDAPINISIKVENCDGMNCDGVCEDATNDGVKSEDVFEGEDHSLHDSLPSSETIRKAELSSAAVHQVQTVLNDPPQVKDTQRKLKTYIGSQSNEKPFSCEVCNKAFRRKFHLRYHMMSHSEEKPYSCVVCCKSFTHQNGLKSHMKTHSGRKKYLCDYCNKRFNKKKYIVEHIRTHTGDKPYSCEICFRKFSQKGSLTYHTRTHSIVKPFSCEVCSKPFTRKCHLRYHMRTHTDKPFLCSFCDKAFHKQTDVEEHEVKHSGSKPFSCNNCDRAFSRKTHLVEHKRIHSGEKPFSCVICSKKFKEKRYLAGHIRRTHSEEKLISCEVRYIPFTHQDSLTDRMRIHSEEKPFTCYICDKAFNDKNRLVEHIAAHSGDQPFDISDKTF